MLENPTDYNAVSEIMWCGSVSHNGLTGLGRTMDFSVHQLGHELGGRFDVAHGASLTTMWAAWANHVLEINPERFARYARTVLGVNENDTKTTAKAGISKTVEFFKKINMPTNFTELGVGIQTEEKLQEMAFSTTHFGMRLVGTFKPLNIEDLYLIFKAANV